MSRIGKKPVLLPRGVDVTVAEQLITVKGPKGSLKRTFHPSMTIVKEGESLMVLPKEESSQNKNFHGLTRSLIHNMVVGVTELFTRELTMIGVGYRAALKGSELHLTLGYSHPVIYQIPAGLEIRVEKQTDLTILGVDKELVGQAAANIRSFRKPEPYHGKGIRYKDERIITKVGKAAGKK
jgi:large subunit ribosomal protein L6